MYYNLRRVFKTSAESLEKIHEDDIPRTIIKRKKIQQSSKFMWCVLSGGVWLKVTYVMTYFTLLVNSTHYTSNKH